MDGVYVCCSLVGETVKATLSIFMLNIIVETRKQFCCMHCAVTLCKIGLASRTVPGKLVHDMHQPLLWTLSAAVTSEKCLFAQLTINTMLGSSAF